jgi:hypothetical protein
MFVVTRAARWFFAPSSAAILMMLMACATSGPSVLPPTDIQEQWNGTWAMTEQGAIQGYLDCCDGPGENIPLTPKYRQIRADYAAIPFTSLGMNEDANLPRCITPGMPGIFQHPLLFDFSWSPGRVNISYEDGTFRRIWTDGRTFPERLLPKRQGTSIGHWEGSTLVVETRGISRQSEMFMMGPIRPGPQTKVTERITLKEGPIKATNLPGNSLNPTGPIKNHLHLQTTLEDPEVFVEPYTYDLYFINVPISFETGCAANNRDDGQAPVDLTPPEDD